MLPKKYSRDDSPKIAFEKNTSNKSTIKNILKMRLIMIIRNVSSIFNTYKFSSFMY